MGVAGLATKILLHVMDQGVAGNGMSSRAFLFNFFQVKAIGFCVKLGTEGRRHFDS